MRVALPLPTIASDGTLAWTPDWDDIEQVLARLLSAADVPVIDAALDLLGWSVRPGATVGAHLSLSALLADPGVAIAAWATAIALDCRHLRVAFGVLATVLSGGSITSPYGLGRVDLPWRAPVAGEPRAPAIVAWTTPPCPPDPLASGGAFALLDGLDGIDPSAGGAVLAAALQRAAVEVPGLGDLLFARQHLGDGLDQLVARWTGTDGVIGPTSTMPADVETVTMPGFSYDELAAVARSDGDALAGLTAPTGAVVHVGCDANWGAGHPDPIDATGGSSGTAAPTGTVPATGDGAWFVAVPTPSAAARARTDHDGVAGQAQHLAEVLANRTAPIVVVAAGAAAAAALRAAATNSNIAAVVTVGAPWSPISVSGLQSGLGGDALALLRRLVPTAAEPLPDELLAQQAWPARRGAGMVRRAAVPRGLDRHPDRLVRRDETKRGAGSHSVGPPLTRCGDRSSNGSLKADGGAVATQVKLEAAPRRSASRTVWWVVGILAVVGLLILGFATGTVREPLRDVGPPSSSPGSRSAPSTP